MRTGLRRVAVAASVAFGAGILALAPALSASAHDYLVSSTPAAGSTQSSALSKVVLTFDDRVLDLSGDGSSNVVEVTNTAGKHFEAGCAAIADTHVTTPVDLGGSGKYTVTWQIVSADGHTVSSSIAFTYEKPAAVTAAVGKASRPACGSAGGSSAAAGVSGGAGGSGASTGSGSSSGTSALGPALGIGGGVVVVAIVAVVIVLVRTRRPSAGPPED